MTVYHLKGRRKQLRGREREKRKKRKKEKREDEENKQINISLIEKEPPNDNRHDITKNKTLQTKKM